MSYAEPTSQRELTDGRARRASRRPIEPMLSVDRAAQIATMPAGCPSSRHSAEDENWDFNPFAIDRPATLSATSSLLELDAVAAIIVAATVSTVQSTRESRPAFIKRIVRAWLDEMERGQ